MGGTTTPVVVWGYVLRESGTNGPAGEHRQLGYG